MKQEQVRFKDQQFLRGFGTIGGSFSGIAKDPAKNDMEILRDKMMKHHDLLVRESNKSRSFDTLSIRQSQVIVQLQTILSTYGWSFGDE